MRSRVDQLTELTWTHNVHDSSHDLPFELPPVDVIYSHLYKMEETTRTNTCFTEKKLPGQRGETLCRWCVASLLPPAFSSPADFQVETWCLNICSCFGWFWDEQASLTWCRKQGGTHLVNPLVQSNLVQLSLHSTVQGEKCSSNKEITFSAEKRWLAILLCSLKKRF